MTISEVSERYELSLDTLRYYERIGLIPKIGRNKSGIREYTTRDCEWIQTIKWMRTAGMTIELLTEYVQMVQGGDATREQRKGLLLEQRAQLVSQIGALEATLQKLDFKIASYEDHCAAKEKRLMAKAE